MDKFEDVIQKHKNSTTEALIRFGEGKRVNKAMADIESNRMYFHYFYEAGQQSRQAEVDFLSAQLGLKRDQIKGFESEIKKAWQVIEEKDKWVEEACESINSFFDNQVSTPTPREYANFIAEILETLRGEHEA